MSCSHQVSRQGKNDLSSLGTVPLLAKVLDRNKDPSESQAIPATRQNCSANHKA